MVEVEAANSRGSASRLIISRLRKIADGTFPCTEQVHTAKDPANKSCQLLKLSPFERVLSLATTWLSQGQAGLRKKDEGCVLFTFVLSCLFFYAWFALK